MKVSRSNLLGRIVKLPPRGESIPISLSVELVDSGVQWDRRFGDFRAVSVQRVLADRFVESAGPFQFELRCEVVDGVLHHRQVGLLVFGVRVPRLFGPRVTGRISGGPDDTSWNVSVVIDHPWFGVICSYEGAMRAL